MPTNPTRPGQVDLHIHAGQEREVSMERLVDAFIDAGVEYLGLLDHSELYEMGDEALKAKMGRLVYPSSRAGLRQFFDEVNAIGVQRGNAAAIFKGIELPEWEILRAPLEAIRSADFVGCHMNTSSHDPSYRHYTHEPCGEHLLKRARQLLKVCREADRPAVLFHPFHRRIQELRRSLQQNGELAEEEVFTGEDLELLTKSIGSERIYVELNFGDIFQAAAMPEVLKLLARTCRTIKAGGLSFSLGSDYHIVPPEFWNPDQVISSLGLNLDDLGLISDLLER